MDIVLSYDASVARAAGGFKSAMQYAVDVLDRLITNPGAVTIDVGYGEVDGQSLGSGVLGESSPNTDTIPYAEVKSELAANAHTAAAHEAAANLPAADPTGGAGVQVSYAQETAWGISLPAASYPAAGYVGFATATSTNFDYSTSGTPGKYAYDFVNVAEHELTHALGRISNLGVYPDPLAPATVLDLFQYASPGVLETGTSEPAYFSINGGTTDLGTFDNTSDFADWAESNGPDAFDAYASPGVIDPVTPVGVTMMNVLGFQVACFAAGTLIRTARGEIAVEALRVGEDGALTAGGGCARIVWTGWRTLVPARHREPLNVTPVRVRANALADGQPTRDLLLSPDHALFVDDVLIPVRHLVNGQTIVREPMARVTYWHVELERHDVLLAEGLPAESYLDTGNRAAFVNGGRVAMLTPAFSRDVWARQGCAELVVDGPALARVRRRSWHRAAALGWRTTGDPALSLLSGGRALPLVWQNDRWVADLPERAGTVRLMSRHFVPADFFEDTPDRRRLGVAVTRLWLDGREAALDSPALGAGWHDLETNWRWTDGDAALDVAGARHLALTLAIAGTYPIRTPVQPLGTRTYAAKRNPG